MKAIVKSKAEVGLWLEDVPEPEIGINDVLIKMLKTGICGTDVHIWNWDAWAQSTIKVPTILGHELVGEIVEVGSNVSDFFRRCRLTIGSQHSRQRIIDCPVFLFISASQMLNPRGNCVKNCRAIFAPRLMPGQCFQPSLRNFLAAIHCDLNQPMIERGVCKAI